MINNYSSARSGRVAGGCFFDIVTDGDSSSGLSVYPPPPLPPTVATPLICQSLVTFYAPHPPGGYYSLVSMGDRTHPHQVTPPPPPHLSVGEGSIRVFALYV